MKIIVYGKPNCSFCEKAKKFLSDRGLQFIYQDIQTPGFDANWLKSLGFVTVPVISIDRVMIPTLHDLEIYFQERNKDLDKLRELLDGGATVSVTFIKATDGKQRVMHCTTNPKFIPESTAPASTKSEYNDRHDPLRFTVYDLVNAGWRSFYGSSVISIN